MSLDDLLASDPARDDMLVLVDGLDRDTGTTTKLEAHVKGLLHRAFSVVLVREGDDGQELLVAKRSMRKYHSGGLWANSCCSHPRAGEDLMDAARRRVREELGCEVRGLREVAAFAYRAEFGNGLCEYEYDHVLVGRCEGDPEPDPAEASEVRWVEPGELACAVAERPEAFAAWAPMVLTMTMAELNAEDV